MTGWLVFLGICILLVLLLFSPIKIKVLYTHELTVRLSYLFVFLRLLGPQKIGSPRKAAAAEKKAEKKALKKAEAAARKRHKAAAGEKKRSWLQTLLDKGGFGGAVETLQSMAGLLTKVSKTLLRHLRVYNLFVEMYFAGEDAAQTALQYGRLCGVVFPSVQAIQTLLKVKKCKVIFEPDFVHEQSRAKLEIKLGIRPVFAIGVGISALFGYLKIMRKKDEKKEGGVVHAGTCDS